MKLAPIHKNSIFNMPVDELIAYYNKELKGSSKLRGFIPAIKIGETLDSYVEMPREEIWKKSFIDIPYQLEKNVLNHIGFHENEEAYIHLRTKLACAMFIKHAQTIQYLAHVIWKEHGSENSIKRMEREITSANSDINRIRSWTIEDDFRKNIFVLFANKIGSYYTLDEKDYSDNSGECLGRIIFFIIIIILFWIWGKCSR